MQDLTKKLIKIHRKIKEEFCIICLFFILSCIIFHSILFNNNPIFYKDANLPWTFDLLKIQLNRCFCLWDPYVLTGQINIINYNRLPLLFLYILSVLTGSVIIAQKLLFVIILSISGIFMYFLVKYLTNNTISASISGLVYMTNPWIFNRIISGHLAIFIAYSLVPLELLYFIKLYENTNYKPIEILLTGTILGAIMMTSPHMTYLIFISLGIIWVYNFIFSLRTNKDKGILINNLLLKLLLVLLVSLSLNLFWILPLLFTKQSVVANYFPPDGEFIRLSKDGSLTNVFIGDSYWMHFTKNLLMEHFGKWIITIWILAGYLLVIISFLTLIFSNKYEKLKYILSFSTIFLLSIFLAKGYNPPFKNINLWLYYNFPGFFAFRDPSKFGFLTVLSLSTLLGYFYQFVYRISKSTTQKGITLIVILSLIVLYGGVIFNSNLSIKAYGGQGIKTLKIPDEYNKLFELLEKDHDYPNFRIAIIPPWIARETFSWTNYSITNPLASVPKIGYIAAEVYSNPSYSNDYSWFVFKSLYENSTDSIGKLLAPFGVKYIVVQKDAKPWPPERANIKLFLNKNESEFLDKQKDLKLIFDNGSLRVYKNLAYMGETFVSNYALAVGDYRLKIATVYSNSYTCYNMPKILVYCNRNCENIEKIIENTQSLIIQPGHFMDLIFCLSKQKYVIYPHNYVGRKNDVLKYWVAGEYSKEIIGLEGLLHPLYPNEKFIYTRGKNSKLSLYFYVYKPGYYDLWIKKYVSSDTGKLIVKINNKSYIVDNDNYWQDTFAWVKFGENVYLNEGKQKLELYSQGINGVSKIVIIPHIEFKELESKFSSYFSNKSLVYIIEAETMRLHNFRIEKVGYSASNGEIIVSVSSKARASTKIYSPIYMKAYIYIYSPTPLKLVNSILKINNETMFITQRQVIGKKLVLLGPIKIRQGWNNISILSNTKNLALDRIDLISTKRFDSNLTLIQQDYRLIINTQSYNQYWKTNIPKSVHIVVENTVNGFLIPEDISKNKIRKIYVINDYNQYQNLGMLISLIAFITICIISCIISLVSKDH